MTENDEAIQAFFERLARQKGPISVAQVRDAMVEELDISPEDPALQEMDEYLEHDDAAVFPRYEALRTLLSRHGYLDLPQPPAREAEPETREQAPQAKSAEGATGAGSHSEAQQQPFPEEQAPPEQAPRQDEHAPHSEREMTKAQAEQLAKQKKKAEPINPHFSIFGGALSGARGLVEAFRAHARPDQAGELYHQGHMETPELAAMQCRGLNRCTERVSDLAAAMPDMAAGQRKQARAKMIDELYQVRDRVQDMERDLASGTYDPDSGDIIRKALGQAQQDLQKVSEDEELDEEIREKIQTMAKALAQAIQQLLARFFPDHNTPEAAPQA